MGYYFHLKEKDGWIILFTIYCLFWIGRKIEGNWEGFS